MLYENNLYQIEHLGQFRSDFGGPTVWFGIVVDGYIHQ